MDKTNEHKTGEKNLENMEKKQEENKDLEGKEESKESPLRRASQLHSTSPFHRASETQRTGPFHRASETQRTGPFHRASESDRTEASQVAEKNNVEKKETEEGKEEEKLENKIGQKAEGKAEKPESKKETKKEVKHPKKTDAFALGASLPISTKHSKEISRFISGKNPEEALELLENAYNMRIAIPFRGEIPHRKGRIMSGRYPIKALEYFIRVLKSAVANASLHNVNIINSRVNAKADMASRPYKRFGSERFKRTNIKITIKESKLNEKLKQNEQNK